ncbi:hypothetical protein [Micromonospora sp. NPDC049301]|uniref:hypothetical protein n=1 Tax=Micromonospora sp. NPDC049301 TaxID=3155723 RepID=UPI00344055F6
MSRPKTRVLAIASFVAALLSVGAFVTVAAISGGWDGGNTAGTWVGGLGTTGAFVAALLLYGREADRDGERNQDRRRQQAEKIAAWYGSEERPVERREEVFSAGPSRETAVVWRVWIRNASELPAFDVLPTLYRRDSEWTTPHRGRVFRTHETLKEDHIGPPLTVPVLPPGKTVELQVTGASTEVSPLVQLEFRDNAGRWWRSAKGRLLEVRRVRCDT